MVKFFNIFLLLGLFCGVEVVCMEGGGAAAEDGDVQQLEGLMSRVQIVYEPRIMIGGEVVEQKPVFCDPILKTPTVKISDRFKEFLSVSDRIRGAFYNFTLFDVADTIVKQKPEFKKNAELIVNHKYQGDHCEALKHLVENGINCYSHKPNPSSDFADLHTKFCLMKNPHEHEILWQGSWNCTGNADENNVECVTVTNSPQAVSAFKEMFKKLITSPNTKPITAADCTCPAKGVSKKGNFAKRLNRIPAEKMER